MGFFASVIVKNIVAVGGAELAPSVFVLDMSEASWPLTGLCFLIYFLFFFFFFTVPLDTKRLSQMVTETARH